MMLSFPENIKRMACNTRQIPALTSGKVIVQIQTEGFLVHRVDCFPEQQGAAVGGYIVQPFYRKHRHDFVNIFLPHKFKYILRLRFCGKGFRVKKSCSHIFCDIDVLSVKALVKQAAVRNHIGGKDNAALFGHADGFPDRLPLILLRIQINEMVIREAQKAEEAGDREDNKPDGGGNSGTMIVDVACVPSGVREPLSRFPAE